jgi:plastocyanin
VACALLLAGIITVLRPNPVGAAVTVSMQNIAFVPPTLTVSIGTTVTWTNQDTVSHTTTSDAAPAWDSGILNKGASFSFTFTKAGTFTYHCNVHPTMHGTITVTPAASPTPTMHPPTSTAPAPPTATPTRVATSTALPIATSTAIGTATETPTAGASAPAAIVTETPSTAPASVANPGLIQSGPVSALGFANFVEPIRPFTDTPDHRFFAATNHTINFGFKSFWEQNGGLALFGYPISELLTETGADGVARTVQYFERYRFEYHAETGTVELGRLGVQIAQAHGYLPAT